jgi:hypothetical protein
MPSEAESALPRMRSLGRGGQLLEVLPSVRDSGFNQRRVIVAVVWKIDVADS